MSTLDNLRKSAKRWLKALRENDADARARLLRAYPKAPSAPGLRDVQHALALEQGHESWTALKEAVLRQAAETRSANPPAEDGVATEAERVATFLRHAAPDWRMGGGPQQIAHRHTAERILRRHPDIAQANLFTRVVCGDLEGVERILAERPDAASEKGGPKDWPPLLYLCAGRLSHPAARDNAVAIARVLLDRGADPNAYFFGGNESIHYTALTLVIGQGEERAPLHADAAALATLLLERGAEPYDNQVFYNISQGYLSDEAIWLLDLIYARSVRLGRLSDWQDPEWSMIDMGGYGKGARFLLEHAVQGNHLKLAQWLLEHGASANASPARDPRWLKHSLYQEAQRLALTEMADLLARHGAVPPVNDIPSLAPPLDDAEAFRAACFRLDREAARAIATRHPEYLQSPAVMHQAAAGDRAEVVALLLDLGMSPDVTDAKKRNARALHVAAYAGAARVAQVLLERGADVDPVDDAHDATPLWWAMWGGKTATIQVLSPHSRDLWAHAALGNVERLRQLLTEDPRRARAGSQVTPLMFLPDDERRALQIVELFLAHGADPTVRNPEGRTAIDIAERRGMIGVAARLRAHAERPSGAPRPPRELYVIDRKTNVIRPRQLLAANEWDVLLDAMREQRVSGLNARGQMTDAVLDRVAGLDHVTRLELDGCDQLTDAGLAHLARMPQLRHLDVSGYNSQITDRGLEVLSRLRALTVFQMCWPRRVSDAGVAHLASCDRLERVNLLGTPTGDGAVAALAGKPKLRHFKTGRQVTDAGLAQLQQFPVFKTWHGGEIGYSLMSPEAAPNHLLIDGPFTDAGLATLGGLDGLFGLSLFWHATACTPAGLASFARLPRLGFLGCEGRLCDDVAMRHIAAIPSLRMLMAQGTVATDAGFQALSRSPTIEYLWGRECPNLTGRGFTALASMPALRGLAVSCKAVDDASLSVLPRFPSLTDLMPMDVQDEGFRHVGRCARLEQLWCMYCRDTTDAATGHIAGLTHLRTYYAGQTRISDRSLEILGRMSSLESVTLSNVAGVTDAGLRFLAGLPRLREVVLEAMVNVTLDGASVFPPHVRVDYS